MRLFLRIVGGLALLLLVAAAVIYVLSEQRMGHTYDVPAATLAVAATPDAVARGEYLAGIMGCQDCHGADLGGKLMLDAPPFRVEPPNLTSGEGGVGGHYDAAEWERAVRHAVGHDGRGLYVMPSSAYRHLSDADMAALVAYLEGVPPVDGARAGVVLKPLGRTLVALGAVEPEIVAEAVAVREAPTPGPTPAYGAYLASFTCNHCHGATLEGGPNPDPAGMPVPSLRPAAGWSAEAFARAVRQGFAPEERRLDPMQMPWPAFSTMTDADVQALYAHLRTLEGLPVHADGMARAAPPR